MLSERPIEIMRMRARVRRLTREEAARVIAAVEAALNGGWDEVRVYPDEGEICTMALKRGPKATPEVLARK